MLFALALPFVTFGFYVALNATIFHCRVIRRPLLFMGLTFPPFLVAQSLAVGSIVQRGTEQAAANPALVYGLPLLIAVLLGLCYVQFYCLIAFSLSLRMLDHFASAPKREMTFHNVRSVYPLEEVLARKCKAAGHIGLLRIEQVSGAENLAVPPKGVAFIRLVVEIKRFCKWNDE